MMPTHACGTRALAGQSSKISGTGHSANAMVPAEEARIDRRINAAYRRAMRALRRHKCPFTLLGVIALLCNVVAALLCCTHSSLVDSPFGSGRFICAADGAKSLPAHRNSQEHFTIGHCPACTPAQFVFDVSIVLIAAEFPISIARARVSSAISLLPLHLSLGGIQSRAPPLSA